MRKQCPTFISSMLTLTIALGCSSEESGSAGVGPNFDANGDGRADLVLEVSGDANSTPWKFGISTARNFDARPLTQAFDFGTHSNGKAIAVGDANGDGRDDVLVQLQSIDGMTQWKVFLSDGTTSTRTIGEVALPTGDDARALAFNDIDGDGFADILLQQQVSGVVSYYMSLSDGGQFSDPDLIYEFDAELGRPDLIALEDINGDGTSDLVFDMQSGASHRYCVRAFRNGRFDAQPENDECWKTADDFTEVEPNEEGLGEGWTTTTRRVQTIGVADLTGDGRSELVFYDRTESVEVFRASRTPGSVQFIENAPVTDASWSYLSLGQGPRGTEWEADSTPIYQDEPDGSQTTLALVDLNNDGRTDLLNESSFYDSALSQTIVSWKAHMSKGDGQFEEELWLEVVTPRDIDLFYGTGIGLRDFNGDGRQDLLINAPRGRGPGLVQLHVLFNDGTQFLQDDWTPWYTNTEQTVRILGLEDDGLTTVARDTSALLAWSGTSNSPRYTENEFREFLRGKGFDLRSDEDGDPSRPLLMNECELIYASADNDDLSVNFATVSCLQTGLDGVQLVQQVVYGGCDVANKGVPGGGIGGARCEIGLFKQELTVDLGGVQQTLTLQGPNANACGAVSLELTCLKGGADYASGSMSAMVGDTGVGAGVGLGVGGGVAAGIEDGVISGEFEVKFVIGVSFEFSFDYEDSGEFLINHGETGFVFVWDNSEVAVVSAGEAIIDLVNILNTSGGVVVGGVGEGINFIGGVATPIGEELVDFVDDAVDAIADFFGF